jgi:hypothetical protein
MKQESELVKICKRTNCSKTDDIRHIFTITKNNIIYKGSLTAHYSGGTCRRAAKDSLPMTVSHGSREHNDPKTRITDWSYCLWKKCNH